MLYNRTTAAWHLSCRKLFAEYRNVYFWTFTFKEVLADWIYPVRWQGFIRDLVYNVYGGRVGGLRVIEVHKEHGLHYHALLNRRVWIRYALRIAKRYGIGRISVSKADLGTALYLAKYLSKQRFHSPVKLVRWHSVGNFVPVHSNDIKVESPFNGLVHLYRLYRQDTVRISRGDYEQLWREHLGVCPPVLSHSLKPSGPIIDQEPAWSPSDLDASWPELAELESNTSTGDGSLPSTSLDSDSSTLENCANGASGTRTRRVYTLYV